MSLLDEVRKELHPKLLLPSLTVGLLVSIMSMGTLISLAALIFSGNLSQFLGGGIGLMLFGALAIGIVVGLTTSLPGVVAIPQDTPAAILALVASGIALAMGSAQPQAVYATVLTAIALTSLVMGVILVMLGRFRLSGFVRYVPYPVVGGFLAGTGWLLAKGAFGVMLGLPMTLANLPQVLTPPHLVYWVPGLIFAIVLLLVLRRFHHFLITPTALIVATGLFYGYLSLAHISVAQASSGGWLLGPFPGGSFYQPLQLSSLTQIDWRAILGQLDKIVTILVLSVIALLLNTSALEVTYHQDIDLNRELVTAGLANMVAGLGGSPVGYQTLSMSSLAYRLGARSRLVNMISGLVCGAVLFFGASLFSYVPKFVLGGMLLYLGLTFMLEWLVDARRTLPLTDYLLVWVIVAIIAAVGFLQGIVVGVLIAAILFVITYSRVNIIRNTLNGRIFHSNVDRPRDHRDILEKHGAEIYILRLQGFIFFGTIQSVLNRIRLRLAEKDQPALGYVVLDFQQVTRLDSSAVFGVTRLRQMAEANHFVMVWTQVSPAIQKQLERGGLVDAKDETFIIRPTLDYGVEWCENKILMRRGTANLTAFIDKLEGQLRRAFPGVPAVERLMKYLQRLQIAQGEVLMREGDPSTDMYFIEAGLVTAQLEEPDGQTVRLRSMRGGTTVGEMGLYLNAPRTASVVASRPTIAYRLSADSLKTMREQEPEVAALLHEWIARLLAERVAASNRTIEALME